MNEILSELNLKVAKKIRLPDGGHVVLASWGFGIAKSVYGENHNIFRLTPDNRIVWQVVRDEQGKWDWEVMTRLAIAEGKADCREPFMTLILQYPDGTTNVSPQTGNAPDEATWQPGCIVRTHSYSGQGYVLDIERGIALNVTLGLQRRW